MVLRIGLFVLMALGLLGFGTVAWVSTHPAAPAKTAEAPPPPVRVQMLAAAHTLRAGSLIKPEDLEPKEIETASAPAGATKDTPAGRGALIGAMVRRSLAADELLMPADVMRIGEHGFLAAVLGPGMRAVTVSVDAVSGTAGLIWPGDRVDLILLQSRDDASLPAGRRVGAETVLADVRVIAIDQRLVQGAGPDANPQGGRTATLEVTPEQAERVSVAASIGKLSLTVRSAEPGPGDKPVAGSGDRSGTAAADPAPVASTTVTWAGDVSPKLNPSTSQAGNSTMHVYHGDGDAKEFKF